MSSNKKNELLSTTMKRTSEWIFSQEIPSDINIRVGSTSFSLHKFPLMSKCGYIRKVVSSSGSTKAIPLEIEFSDVPGGSEAFELAANFCYGVNFEIRVDNIAMLRCVAEYLEMTEECAAGNLIGRTEAYLSQVALQNVAGSISVLQSCEKLVPLAEEVKLVSRCIDSIAYMACNDDQSWELVSPGLDAWWAQDLALLSIDFFQRLLVAMMARGFSQYSLAPILMIYAQNSLTDLDVWEMEKKGIDARKEKGKRVVVETIVSMLPKEKNALSVSFLAMLLRFAIYLETTVACRVDLEKRIALQLGQAVVEDLLIPSYYVAGCTLLDVDTVRRIVLNYLEEEYIFHSPSEVESVGDLIESYLTEIASDCNLTVAKFMAIAQLIPKKMRAVQDGMYRAIDVFLKVHPETSEIERKKVCSLMDCKNLSREACAHAAKNKRITAQTIVQVLYYEQQRLREALDSTNRGTQPSPTPTRLAVASNSSDQMRNELARLRRENEDLRVELVKTKMRLKEMERCASSPISLSAAAHKPRLHRNSFISSISKKLGRLYPLVKLDVVNPAFTVKARTKSGRDRRHSIS